jgi:hypothetical protein
MRVGPGIAAVQASSRLLQFPDHFPRSALKQSLGLLQIERAKAFGEPTTADRSEEIAGLIGKRSTDVSAMRGLEHREGLRSLATAQRLNK